MSDAQKKTLATLRWDKYKIRRCLSLHHCEICNRDILLGERYYDGGYSRRAHEKCLSAGGYAILSEAGE